jgi:coenzyme F420 biosynthesis associated uncharacterized protein
MGSQGDGAALIDWRLARATANRLMASSPTTSPTEADEVVDELRRLADESVGHVAEHTGMRVPHPGPPTVVVDRPGWLDVNLDSFALNMKPMLDRMAASAGNPMLGVVSQVGSRVTGVELGALLAYISSRVLGQYEPFLPSVGAPERGNGTLLLVAPNIVAVERDLGVDPTDFRRWVCLHEETHRVQFNAVPWMREYTASLIRRLTTDAALDARVLATWGANLVRAVTELSRGKGVTLRDLITTDEQRRTLDSLTALMSLLEGHAEHVMDGVGPSVVPSVAEIRVAFQARRQRSGLDSLMRQLLGLEAKMRQYRDGEKFVTAVVTKVGMAGFNEVWTAPERLPTLAEIHDPAAWVTRVHGVHAGSRTKRVATEAAAPPTDPAAAPGEPGAAAAELPAPAGDGRRQ